METKKCYRCGIEKPLTDFHKHYKMPQGRRNICKECACREERARQFRLSQDPTYYEKQRERGRDKYRRLYAEQHKKSTHNENKDASRDLKAIGVNLDGYEIHHWDYNQRKNVFLLSPRAHKRAHLLLTFDKDTKKFKHNDILLQTKEEHLNVILLALKDFNPLVEHEPIEEVIRIRTTI